MPPWVFLAIIVAVGIAYSVWREFRQVSIGNAVDLIRAGKREKGKAMLRALVDKGNVKALMPLAAAEMAAGNSGEAVKHLTKAAEKGYLEANETLAMLYIRGDFLEKDLPRAKQWLEPAAENGSAQSQYVLGLICIEEGDWAAGEKWITLAQTRGAKVDPDILTRIKLRKAMQMHNPAGAWDKAMAGSVPGRESPEEREALARRDAARDEMASRIADVVTREYTRDGILDRRTALSALGAMSGFGCQIGIRDGLIASGEIPEGAAFVVLATKSGDTFYFGDLLNRPLFEFPVSVHSWILGGVIKAGGNALPDVKETAKRVAEAIGSDAFFTLDVPERDRPAEPPLESLRRLWPKLYLEIRSKYATTGNGAINPNELGWLFAMAVQHLLAAPDADLEPEAGGRIAFEAAMRIAKIDPKKVMA